MTAFVPPDDSPLPRYRTFMADGLEQALSFIHRNRLDDLEHWIACQHWSPEGKFTRLFRDEVMPALHAGNTQAAIAAIESRMTKRGRRDVERAYRSSPKAGDL